MRPATRAVLLTLLAIAVITPAVLFYGMKVSPISWQVLDRINNDSGLALNGYDPVAYFNDGKAIKGDTSKGLKWLGTIWYFSSDANKLMFKTFPEKYVPQYGGYCATAVASGFTADIDPEAWLIRNEKLFLFFNNSARNDFKANIDNGIINRADTEWAKR